jgi:hypothetical protein
MAKRTDKMHSIRELYAEFLRYPNSNTRIADGVPPTKAAFCEKYDINRATVWHWEQDPEFMREVHNDVLGALGIEEVEKIKWALKIKAFEGNVAASKLLLEWAGLYGRNATTTLEPDDADIVEGIMSKMSDEELKKILEAQDKEEADGEE